MIQNIMAFTVGTVFFLILGCNVYSILGGFLFVLFAKAESTVK